jgi:hypothetical protein
MKGKEEKKIRISSWTIDTEGKQDREWTKPILFSFAVVQING